MARLDSTSGEAGEQMKEKEIWQAALGELEISLSKANFTTWFKNTLLLSAEDGIFAISVPNAFTKEWLQNKYHDQIVEALNNVAKDVKKVVYQVGQPVTANESVVLVAQTKKQPIANGQFNSKYTFETFIVGNSNKLAAAAAQAVAKSPGKTYNPLFIYGGVGLGKTHLMQAIGHDILKNSPKQKIIYVSCERFTNDFIQSISSGKVEKFKETYRNVDILLIDDIQFLAGKEGTQEEFFHTFNTLHQEDKQIVISSDRPPKAIPTLEERLRSRFEWGMIVDIQPPDFETRIAILETKSKEKGYKINSEVLGYIAKNIQYNIRELEGALNRVMVYCQFNDLNPTLEIASDILSEILATPKKQSVSCEKVVEIVAGFYNLKINEIKGIKRNKELVLPRQISMFLMREEIGQSFPKIAQVLGGKDHTTIMYGYKKLKKEISENENLRHEISLIKERIYS